MRKRANRRTSRAEFAVTAAMRKAFRAYIKSTSIDGGAWAEHWTLHDLLHKAGVLQLPFISPCCWHPEAGVDWAVLPDAVAIYHRLDAAEGGLFT